VAGAGGFDGRMQIGERADVNHGNPFRSNDKPARVAAEARNQACSVSNRPRN
jgi:hypothetical protein